MQVTPSDVLEFLVRQEIVQPNLLVEVYLDKYQSFMLLEACKHALVVWDFATADYENPGVLNVRLTDLSELELSGGGGGGSLSQPGPSAQQVAPSQHANTSPVGLFSFCMMAGLESTALLASMFGDSAISPVFMLSYGPIMLFMGGLLQFTVATFQVLRNNIYGATAFFGFGAFWMAAGVSQILQLYVAVPGTRAHDIITAATESSDNDAVGAFIRTMFMLSFTVALWIQTFRMNKLTTILILILIFKLLFASLMGFTETSMQYAHLIAGYITSIFAFYVFLVEFTNNVYDREVFCTYKWSDLHSPEEVFGAAGKIGTLRSRATKLRQARYSTQRDTRAALSSSQKGEGLSPPLAEAFPKTEKEE